MAMAKQCDRCGKFYNPYPMSNNPNNNPNMYNALRHIRMNDSNMVELTASSPIDLCRECMSEFDKFINMSDMQYKKEDKNDVEF